MTAKNYGFILKAINENYWTPLFNYLKDNTHLIKTFPALLLEAEQVVLYLGKTHLAIEYFGKETTTKLPELDSLKVVAYDYTEIESNFFEEIIGFKYDSTLGDIVIPLPQYSDDWVWPTNRGLDKMIELNWNWMAQNSIFGMNLPSFHIDEGKFTRLVNSRFYDADETGLKTRTIKWIDFLPLEIVEENDDMYNFKLSLNKLSQLVVHDANFRYPLPDKEDFKYTKLPQINRFIELLGIKDTSEPDITSFLSKQENLFILTMGFLAQIVFPQVLCIWQSENRENIQPDFFVVKPNGYADIIEFKLPDLKSKTVVGKTNRETFSAEVNSYISQTRVYREYFEDPNNRKWVEKEHKMKVRYPRRTLIIGRRWDFSNEGWKEIIEDYKDITIMTYDDLIDGVVAQFYM